MKPDVAPGPVDFSTVLEEELAYLEGKPPRKPARPLKQIYGEIAARPGTPGQAPLSALCLSGGGIRSATFCLGVIQALTRKGLLDRFDYLSSVSGGGYIAGWLQAWISRDGTQRVHDLLTDPPSADKPLDPEPGPLDHLREYSNYLTPRLGLFSADTWAFLALTLRNLLLNWLVILPLLAAFIAVPQITFIIAAGSKQLCGDPASASTLQRLAPWTFWLSVGCATAAAFTVHLFRRRRTHPANENSVLMLGVLPLWLSALGLSACGLWQCRPSYSWGELWQFAALWSVAIPLAGWLTARFVARDEPETAGPLSELIGIVSSGVIAGALLATVVHFWFEPLSTRPALYVMTAVPVLLGVYLISRALFVAFASLGERDKPLLKDEPSVAELAQADREWWARFSGWVLLCATSWIGVSGLIVLGAFAVRTLTAASGDWSALVASLSGAVSVISGLAAALLGSSATTTATDEQPQGESTWRNLALRGCTFLSVCAIVVLLASLVRIVGAHLTGFDTLLRIDALTDGLPVPNVPTLVGITVLFAAVALFSAGVSILFGAVVNVNRFSAHGLYRNRLMRAYLGASNAKRDPDPFTGFDPRDNIRLAELTTASRPRPLPVINTALNLVRAQKLAWQQRKAESFSMTPLFCGNYHAGYRRSFQYGGRNGITLATAMTISGAAANPNAGYHSSPLVAFLMTLFNVRLGCWLPNTNKYGNGLTSHSGPDHAGLTLFKELLSLTDETHAFVNLSDGGHFENLGIYEMILRRCRHIVAVDSGQDAKFDFEDLGNLIRKVRIDFGVPVEFETPIQILPREGKDDPTGLICAIGHVRYSRVDGTGADEDGRILYLKPTLRAAKAFPPYDVVSYSRTSSTFPHETTADQWFSEAQFESYRALGEHLVTRLLDGQRIGSVHDLFVAAERAARRQPAADGVQKDA